MRRILQRGIKIVSPVFVILFSISFHFPEYHSLSNQRIDPPFIDSGTEWVDSVMSTLSLDEKIAQMLMIDAYSNKGHDHLDEISRIIRKYNVGGIIFFQGGPARQAIMTNHFQEVTETPLLIATDAEWGLGMRLDSTITYPRQMMLGAIQDNDLIYQMGNDIASQLKRIGVHMNFAPVIDINNNPANPVINYRSFGEDKNNVAEKGIAYMKGMQDNNILCTAKHFPGHGDTGSDSHYTLPVIPHPLERLKDIELYPFEKCIHQGLTGIMMAHLHIPSLDSTSNLASSLSYPVVSDLLRDEMGFKGLIVTDALNMKAVSQYFKPGEVEAQAALAGNDLLLMPANVGKAIQAIRREVRKGNISREEIDDRCRRILSAKQWVGLDECKPVEIDNIYQDLNDRQFMLGKNKLVEAALTLLRNESGIVPGQRLDTLKIASISLGSDTVNTFQEYLSLYTAVDHFCLPWDNIINRIDSVKRLLDPYNLIIAGVHSNDLRINRNYGLPKGIFNFIDEMTSNKSLILSVFSNPYCLSDIRGPEHVAAIVMAYEENEITQQYAAQLIFGGIPAMGKLPVSSGHYFKVGDGVDTGNDFRLRYALPESVGMDGNYLEKIDSIVMDAIKEKAFPGCQVLASRNGTVVYHKAFGYHTYSKKNPVHLTDLYDLASITKIVSTLPALMQLTDKGLFNIEDTLGVYLPDLDTTNKSGLIIKEILAHQSGLNSWIPFYYSTLETLDPDESLISNRLSAKYPFRLSNHIFLNKNLRYVPGAYMKEFSEEYPYIVAECLFLNRDYKDSVFHKIVHSDILDEKEYLYSDLGYYFFQEIIEQTTDTTLYSYIYHNLYKTIGANYTGYLPLNRFSHDMIVPTENDVYFRRQLLHGYVHDPGAAMMGGVAGHAGVFSNANDLAKIMSMYLHKGKYGGLRYIGEETFDMFNSCPYCDQENRRGIGFDKPEMDYEKEGPTCQCVSPESFGHTGFTGTMAWADPETGIIYIFLSNRIHPDQDNLKIVEMNIRTKIQQVIYDALVNGGG